MPVSCEASLNRTEMAGGEVAAQQSPMRKRLLAHVDAAADDVITVCQQLVRIPSENPPGSTHVIAEPERPCCARSMVSRSS